MLWLPLLAKHPRLIRDFDQRLELKPMPPVDLWIQAASAGEAYLALLLLQYLPATMPIHVLMTSNTRQGLQILKRAVAHPLRKSVCRTVTIALFPFDRPAIMQKVVGLIRPKVVVFLEAEIWPGLLAVLKQNAISSCIINGCMSSRSLRRYMLWPSFWRSIRPDAVLAVSARDAQRYGALFGKRHVRIMSNMKFDRLQEGCQKTSGSNPVQALVAPKVPFVVMGSVRQAERHAILHMLQQILQPNPETVLGLFPRHLETIPLWEHALQQSSLKWQLRSHCAKPAAPGTIILWDIFGEMNQAFEVATAAFIGGSLVPLGGQNFLEALTHGVTPVIGPFWDDFFWVGQDIIRRGLVRQAHNWREAAQHITKVLGQTHNRLMIRTLACQYLQSRQGGTRQACGLIEKLLDQVG
jgi:3-deoxy-D-manno-octulosonic-acid transferase